MTLPHSSTALQIQVKLILENVQYLSPENKHLLNKPMTDPNSYLYISLACS